MMKHEDTRSLRIAIALLAIITLLLLVQSWRQQRQIDLLEDNQTTMSKQLFDLKSDQ